MELNFGYVVELIKIYVYLELEIMEPNSFRNTAPFSFEKVGFQAIFFRAKKSQILNRRRYGHEICAILFISRQTSKWTPWLSVLGADFP